MSPRPPGTAAPPGPWRRRLHEIIFEAETPGGRAFDLLLIFSIVLSVLVVMLESLAEVASAYAGALRGLEWFFTLLFTVEYGLRLVCVRQPGRYARSFFGVVDLLAVLPTYLGVLLPGIGFLRVVRVLRVLRIFRVLKLAVYLEEADLLLRALHASRRKIAVFVFGVLVLVIILGSFMYALEGPEHGFTSIPLSIYWAIVTLTTVGYGDISPQTVPGQALASVIMILGYGIIAVPTGIVGVEVGRAAAVSTEACPACGAEGHRPEADHCFACGAAL